MDSPAQVAYIKPNSHLGPMSLQSLFGELWCANASLGGSSAGWPAANRAIFIPFYLNTTEIVKQAFWLTNSTGSFNIDTGVYDVYGNRIVSLGSTAFVGAALGIQVVDLTDTTLDPGAYFMALVASATTGTSPFFGDRAIPALTLRQMGIQEMASAFPLPAIATFANPSSAFVPHMALSLEAVN